jgi:hypothetical protein
MVVERVAGEIIQLHRLPIMIKGSSGVALGDFGDVSFTRLRWWTLGPQRTSQGFFFVLSTVHPAALRPADT